MENENKLLKDELTALREELASANADKEAYAQNAIDLRSQLEELREELITQDRVLRSSVPVEHKHCTSAVGSVQNYIADLEQRNSDLIENLAVAYEWDYGDGQNNPNGYSDKADRDACVASLAKPTESGASE